LAMEQNRDVYAVPGNVTNKNAWGPNTLIKQGAKLTATWEDVWEELSSEVKLQLEEARGFTAGDESKTSGAASLFNETPLAEHERLVLERLRHDEATQLDELIERLEAELGSPEIFTALFELELAGRVKQLPGKNYVRAF
jgi:DNA processing protein